MELKKVSGVILNFDSTKEGENELLNCGFVRMPRYIELVIQTTEKEIRLNRRLEKDVLRSLQIWRSLNAEIRLEHSSLLSIDEVNKLYYDLLVPELYCKGWSPYGLHNYDKYLKLIDKESWVARVFRDNKVIGVAFLTSKKFNDRKLLFGSILGDSVFCGQVYCFRPEFVGLQRALFFTLIQKIRELGIESFSVGQDSPWMQKKYSKVFIEKLRWADSLVSCEGPHYTYGSFNKCGEDTLYFEKKSMGLNLIGSNGLKSELSRIEKLVQNLRNI